MLWSLITKFQTWLAVAGAVLLAIGYAFLRGMSTGKDQIIKENQKARERAIEKRKNVENETKHMDDASLDRDNSRWVRK